MIIIIINIIKKNLKEKKKQLKKTKLYSDSWALTEQELKRKRIYIYLKKKNFHN